MIVELDGKIHLLQKEYDAERTKERKDLGLEIIRFSNEEVETEIEKVIEIITETVKQRLQAKS